MEDYPNLHNSHPSGISNGIACYKRTKANKSFLYLGRITAVLGRDYSSTSQEITPVLRRRLLQYLAEITAVLGADYCSTWAKYWLIKEKVILRIEEYSSFYR